MKDGSFPTVAWSILIKEMELPYASNPYFYWDSHNPLSRFYLWQDPDASVWLDRNQYSPGVWPETLLTAPEAPFSCH